MKYVVSFALAAILMLVMIFAVCMLSGCTDDKTPKPTEAVEPEATDEVEAPTDEVEEVPTDEINEEPPVEEATEEVLNE